MMYVMYVYVMKSYVIR